MAGGRDTRAVAHGFLTDLETGAPLERVAAWFHPDAIWWVDTGPDRAAGRWDAAPAPHAPWPLHGPLPALDKIERIAKELRGWSSGLRQQLVRVIGHDGPWVAAEAVGSGRTPAGREYANRYAFLMQVRDGRLQRVHEYVDTWHADDVLGDGVPVRRTEVDLSTMPKPDPTPRNPAEAAALSLWEPLARGDLDRFAECFVPGATWWTDSGPDRAAGAFDAPADHPRRWPFHGVVPMDAKLRNMRDRLEFVFPDGVAVHPVRLVSDPPTVVIEAWSDARMSSGRRYQNRYAFVVEAGPGGVASVREYCDTRHLVDLGAPAGDMGPVPTGYGQFRPSG